MQSIIAVVVVAMSSSSSCVCRPKQSENAAIERACTRANASGTTSTSVNLLFSCHPAVHRAVRRHYIKTKTHNEIIVDSTIWRGNRDWPLPQPTFKPNVSKTLNRNDRQQYSIDDRYPGPANSHTRNPPTDWLQAMAGVDGLAHVNSLPPFHTPKSQFMIRSLVRR